MNTINNLNSTPETANPEAIALAACYRLLLQKYRERQVLAAEAAEPVDNTIDEANPCQQVSENAPNG